jgi:formate dehydrogenase alpha subunit
MVINTESPKVLERRKTIIQLILASHPDTCMVCDKGNRCELRTIAANLGVGFSDLERIPQRAAIEEVNPFIERDLSKCILCGKCIRADHEIVVEGAIDYMHRGFVSKPATLGDRPLEGSECTFCGTCVAMCPTGALMEKRRVYAGSTSSEVPTVCPFCGCGCNIVLEVKDGLIVRARPGDEGSVNRRALCVKGSYGCDFVHSPDRLTSPLIKTSEGFEEASWDQALGLVASELKRLKETHGSGSLAVLGSPKGTNEDNYLLQMLTRVVLGTNNIDNSSRLYSAPEVMGVGSAVGFPGTTNTLDVLEKSDVIMVIGADIWSSAPIVAYAVKRAARYHGARVLLVDPRRTKLASFAQLWLRPKVGTDVALLNGMARVVVTEGLTDEEFVTRKTDNFEAFRTSLGQYTPEYVEEVTGVPGESMCQAARLLGGANMASIVCGSGITQQIAGTDGVTALANLAMLTGNVSPSGGIFAIQRDCNGLGACDMGTMPDLLPGYLSADDSKSREKFAARWGTDLPVDVGLTAVEMIEQARDGKVKGMYIVGENPMLSFPNAGLVEEALSSLEFLVVQDMFLTETARLANVVLPAASFAEKDGTFTDFEGRVGCVRKAIGPIGHSLPDWEIVLRLAEHLGSPMPYPSLEHVMDEIRELVPLYQGIGYGSVETKDMFRTEPYSNPFRKRRVYRGQFPSGFGRFLAVQHEPQAELATDGYPLVLLTGSVLYHSGSGSRSSRSRRLSGFVPDAYVEIGTADAEEIGVGDGDEVRIVSPVGELTAVARFTDALPEGMVFMPVSLPSGPANKLFDVVLDPRVKTPAMKACAVRLERVQPRE